MTSASMLLYQQWLPLTSSTTLSAMTLFLLLTVSNNNRCRDMKDIFDGFSLLPVIAITLLYRSCVSDSAIIKIIKWKYWQDIFFQAENHLCYKRATSFHLNLLAVFVCHTRLTLDPLLQPVSSPTSPRWSAPHRRRRRLFLRLTRSPRRQTHL
jgi:hypothetical protein